jgi:hypothetical protein
MGSKKKLRDNLPGLFLYLISIMLFAKRYLVLTLICLAVISCKQKENKVQQKGSTIPSTKPGSSFADTLDIQTASAVFYLPDSLQLEKIKARTDKRIFEGSMHEYFYQQRNAGIFLKQYWPGLKIYEAKNFRYLRFIKSDKQAEIVDLDKSNDACGIYIFDPGKSPLQIDMMNVETQVDQYFKTPINQQ